MLPQKRTRTGNKTVTERGAKTKTGTDGANEVIPAPPPPPQPQALFLCTAQFFFHVSIGSAVERKSLVGKFLFLSACINPGGNCDCYFLFQTSASTATAVGAAVAARSAERGASAPREMAGLNVSAEGVRGTSHPHPNSVQEVLLFLLSNLFSIS